VPEEWSLIELNGTLNCTGGANHAATGEGLGGLPLGQLSFPAPDKVRQEGGKLMEDRQAQRVLVIVA